MREPEHILAQARSTLDFEQPVAVLLLGILGHAADTFEQMQAITSSLVAAVPSGSYLVVAG